jgi:hypothetical protein
MAKSYHWSWRAWRSRWKVMGLASATESYAASALYTTLASLSDALWRIRRAVANYKHINTWEHPEVVVWMSGFSIHTIEVKVSKSDFRRDAEKPFRHTSDEYHQRCLKDFDKQLKRHQASVAEEERKNRERHMLMNERRRNNGVPEEPYVEPVGAHWKKFWYSGPWRHKGMGNYRSYLCPEGLIVPGDIPDGWGLIWYSPHNGGTFRVKVQPKELPTEEVNHHGGASYMFVIMKRMVQNIENWQEAAAWGRRGKFVKNGGSLNGAPHLLRGHSRICPLRRYFSTSQAHVRRGYGAL